MKKNSALAGRNFCQQQFFVDVCCRVQLDIRRRIPLCKCDLLGARYDRTCLFVCSVSKCCCVQSVIFAFWQTGPACVRSKIMIANTTQKNLVTTMCCSNRRHTCLLHITLHCTSTPSSPHTYHISHTQWTSTHHLKAPELRSLLILSDSHWTSASMSSSVAIASFAASSMYGVITRTKNVWGHHDAADQL